MPLLNYTTQVDVEKTIGEIQKCLQIHGANAILTEYDDQGYVASVSFKIRVNDKDMGFRLPTDWHPVLQVLEQQNVGSRFKTQEQALRVAWRIVKDWVEAQMAIVETKMVTMPQVFLPYAVTRSGRTLYEKILDGGDDSTKLLN